MNNYVSQHYNWLDTTMYPFKNRFVQLAAGSMHYIDEGQGEVILFVHGTPTWSFLYRNYVAKLSQKYRCIAIDHIGFGLSEKPENFPGNPQAHARNLSEFMDRLDLKDITLVVHDFGGPIGLAAAINQPGRIKRIVAFNTWLWETKNEPAAKSIDKIVNNIVGRFLYLRLNISPKVLLKKGFDNKEHLSGNVHKHYLKPFPDKTSRLSLLNLAKSLVGSSVWYEDQWNNLSLISEKPWLILWGTKDHFIHTGYLKKWKERLPGAKVTEYETGHFVQEEKTEESIHEIELFLNKS